MVATPLVNMNINVKEKQNRIRKTQIESWVNKNEEDSEGYGTCFRGKTLYLIEKEEEETMKCEWMNVDVHVIIQIMKR